MGLLTTLAYATNGGYLISHGVHSRGMGGVGVGLYHGSENVYANPALLTEVPTLSELALTANYVQANVSSQNLSTHKRFKSKANSFLIPAISRVDQLNNNLYVGLGTNSSGGFGVDYRGAKNDDVYNMSTTLVVMKFMPSLAYRLHDWSFGVTGVIAYGLFGISYNTHETYYDKEGNKVALGNQGSGVSNCFGTGYELGASYQYYDTSFGVHYRSPILMSYRHQLAALSDDFQGVKRTDRLDEPASVALGIGHTYGHWAFGVDWRKILWSDAAGYSEFGWRDQDIYALGVRYRYHSLSFKGGYNYGASPITHHVKGIEGTFNAIGYPAIATRHYTFGVSRYFGDGFSIDTAFVTSLKEHVTTSQNSSFEAIKTEQSMNAFSFSLRWNI